MLTNASSSNSASVAMTGRRPINSGNQTEFNQVFRLNVSNNPVCRHFRPCCERTRQNRYRLFRYADGSLFPSPQNAPPQINRMLGRIDVDKFLIRMFAAALGRNTGNRTFNQFQQGLLHTFAGYVAGNRRVVAFTGDFCRFRRYRRCRAGLFQHQNRIYLKAW